MMHFIIIAGLIGFIVSLSKNTAKTTFRTEYRNLHPLPPWNPKPLFPRPPPHADPAQPQPGDPDYEKCRAYELKRRAELTSKARVRQ